MRTRIFWLVLLALCLGACCLKPNVPCVPIL